MPNWMGSSQSTLGLGNLSWERRGVLSDPIGSDQPCLQVSNLNRGSYDLIPVDALSTMVTEQTESRISNSSEQSGCNSSLPQISRWLLGLRAKDLWSRRIEPTA